MPCQADAFADHCNGTLVVAALMQTSCSSGRGGAEAGGGRDATQYIMHAATVLIGRTERRARCRCREEMLDERALAAAIVAVKAAEEGRALGALEMCSKLVSNVLAKDDPKFRRVKTTNPKLQAALFSVDGGRELLIAIGMQVSTGPPK